MFKKFKSPLRKRTTAYGFAFFIERIFNPDLSLDDTPTLVAYSMLVVFAFLANHESAQRFR
jgi:hypothetical protein